MLAAIAEVEGIIAQEKEDLAALRTEQLETAIRGRLQEAERVMRAKHEEDMAALKEKVAEENTQFKTEVQRIQSEAAREKVKCKYSSRPVLMLKM